jgi:hypothetical protein
METGHSRENTKIPQQQVTHRATTQRCKRLTGILSAANKQAATRNEKR